MGEANAKTLRPLVRPELKRAAESRGWRSAKGGAFVAGPELVVEPLVVRLDPILEGDAYGGIRFGLDVWITDPPAEEEASGYGADALPDSLYLELGGWAVDSINAGALTDPNGSVRYWLVTDTDDVESTVQEWADVLDGPIRTWIDARSSEERLLDLIAADPELVARRPLPTRLAALMALRSGRVELARTLLGRYEPGADDDAERTAAFERRLAEGHPEYGPLQRT